MSCRVVLLLVLGVSIGGPALDPEFELPAHHFDGDADDAGHVGKVFAHWVAAAVDRYSPDGRPFGADAVPGAERRPQAATDRPRASRFSRSSRLAAISLATLN